MIKRQLLEGLAADFPWVSRRDVHAIVDLLFESMAQALMQGEAVEIRGLGRFSVKKRAPLRTRNPRSGVLMDVPQRWAVIFKPSQDLNTLTEKS